MSEARPLLFCEVSDDGLVAGGSLPYVHLDISINGQIEVYARAELNEAQMLIDVALLIGVNISNNTTGYSACHLAYEYLSALRRFYDYRRALIICTGFGEPSSLKATVLMINAAHCTIDWHPVGMNVEQAHEDAHHDAAVVEILVFLDLFYDHHPAVARSYDHAVSVLGEKTYRATEEIDHYEVHHRAGYHKPKKPWTRKAYCPTHQQAKRSQTNGTPYEGRCAFTM